MSRTYSLPKSRHLRRPAEFQSVYAGKTRESRGPLTLYALPNEFGHPRLGMSVARKVGTAVRRNRIRRLIRESFRLLQHDLPQGYDWVVVVRPHEPLILAEYQKLLMALIVRLHQVWERRKPKDSPAPTPAPQGPPQPPAP